VIDFAIKTRHTPSWETLYGGGVLSASDLVSFSMAWMSSQNPKAQDQDLLYSGSWWNESSGEGSALP
jgi:hypothetical protein